MFESSNNWEKKWVYNSDHAFLKRFLTISLSFKCTPDLHGVKLEIRALLNWFQHYHCTPVDQLYIQCQNKTIESYCLMSGCQQNMFHIIHPVDSGDDKIQIRRCSSSRPLNIHLQAASKTWNQQNIWRWCYESLGWYLKSFWNRFVKPQLKKGSN